MSDTEAELKPQLDSGAITRLFQNASVEFLSMFEIPIFLFSHAPKPSVIAATLRLILVLKH